MRLSNTPSGRKASTAYTDTANSPRVTVAAATLHEENDSSDSLNDSTNEEKNPLVNSSKNRPYLDYGASGMPALRIENLKKVSLLTCIHVILKIMPNNRITD